MRTSVLLFLFAAVVLTACKKKGKDCPADSYKYTFKDNAQVDTITVPNSFLAANTGAGNKRVFKYAWTHSECPEIQDGMGGAVLLFEADPAVTYFKYKTDKLAEVKCYCRYICYGCDGASIPAGGTIEGTKLNDREWKVSLDLSTGGARSVKTTASFIRE